MTKLATGCLTRLDGGQSTISVIVLDEVRSWGDVGRTLEREWVGVRSSICRRLRILA